MPALRVIDPAMSPVAVAQVDSMLAEIRDAEGVHIPWAIESGSRAWGFPSPDSDYDARFIYVRPAGQALTIWPRRDVVERPIIGDMDVNGWDLSKALRLLLKGNAVVVEWLQSPIIYRGEDWFRDGLLGFAETWMDRDRLAAHYFHLAGRQRRLHIGDPNEPFALKKVFYALRPAAALRWLRLHPDGVLPPMHFPALIAESDPPGEVAALVEGLIAKKAITRELGLGIVPAAILTFIDEELAREAPRERAISPSREAMAAADDFFASATLRLDAAVSASSPP